MNPFDQRLSPPAAPPLLLTAAPARAALISAQLRAAGRSVDEAVGPGDPLTPGGRLVVADTHGCTPAQVDAMLARINSVDPSAPLLLVLPFDQVDHVVGAVTRPRVHYLCEPSSAEFAAAAVGVDRAREQGEDSEAERLRRIDEEVARIAQVLARLTADRDGADSLKDRQRGYDPGPDSSTPARTMTIDALLIRRIIRARRLRDQHFDAALFADPAWDMLLDLYAAELDRGQVSVSSLCIAAAVPPTTALRWIAAMTDRGLFVRDADPFDKRRIFIALDPSASAAMRAYFAALVRQGLPLVG